MKILHVIGGMSSGGAQRLIAELLPIFKKQHDVTLLVNNKVNNNYIDKIEKSGVTVISLNYPRIHSYRNIWKIAKKMKGYDIVHVHLFPSLYWVALANLFYRIPLVYTEHSTYNKRRSHWYWRMLEQWVYGRYSKIISISDFTQKNLKNWLNAKNDDKRFVVVNNGVDIKAFSNVEYHKIYPYTLIMVARFAPAKDQETIIKTMTLLPVDVHLILVGDGPNQEKCEELSRSLGLKERIHFVGRQADIPSWIAKADIGIQSSRWEGFGLTAVEMMAGGLPVIATDVDGLREVVEGAGILFPLGNEKELAAIVRRLMGDKNYYHDTQKKCVLRAERYNIQTMADSYMKVYRDVFESSL